MDLHRAYPDVLTPAEAAHLASLMEPEQSAAPRHRIARAHTVADATRFLVTGFAARYRLDRAGRRQFLSLHIPGDFLDLPSFVLGRLDHDIDSVTAVSQRTITHASMVRLRDSAPNTLDKLWRISLIDGAIHRYWIFRMGRLRGRARIASLFGEMMLRQYARGLCGLDRFSLPITQADLAEASGMTPVHANRMVAELREEGICTFADGEVTVTDLRGLIRTGEVTWDWLYLPAEVEARLRSQLCMPAGAAATA